MKKLATIAFLGLGILGFSQTTNVPQENRMRDNTLLVKTDHTELEAKKKAGEEKAKLPKPYNPKANAQADKNFFFIDEGFGTQDTESVNIVFETLTNLMKENRIVGIISHVEELKEKIPTALNIVKDEERGSLIEIV